MNDSLTKVKFTNLEKILFSQLRITKAQLIEYYIRIAPRMLMFLANRPIVLTRYPNGIDMGGFYEKDAPEGTPSWVPTYKIYSETAHRDVNYVLCNDLDTLVWLANLATIEIHIPLSKIEARDKPDFIFFDIDPEPPASYEDVMTVGLYLKEKLDQLELKSYVKTSGKKGLHILVPIVQEYTFKQTRAFVHKIGQQIANEHENVVSELSDTKKPGKIFMDYLQNTQGRTNVSPYSLRGVPEATVSTPIEWSDVEKRIKPSEFNIFTVPSLKKDPWKDIFEIKQKLDGK